jgi:hypothetical protein
MRLSRAWEPVRFPAAGPTDETGWVAMGMTQQYQAGELSLLLARLQAVAADEAAVRDVARLRHQTEAGPLSGLGSVVARALALTDTLCWDSLQRGDGAAFTSQAAMCVELCQFAVCAGLLDEGYSS